MARALAVRFAVVMLALSAMLVAQAPPAQRRGRPGRRPDTAEPTGPTAQAVLEMAHDAAQELPAADRAPLLSDAIARAQRIAPQHVRDWTDELFGLMPQVAEAKRPNLEVAPVMAVSVSDVDYALDLLERMDAPTAETLASGTDPRTSVAANVFARAWREQQRRREEDADKPSSRAATNAQGKNSAGAAHRAASSDEPNATPDEPDAKQKDAVQRLKSVAAHLGASGVYPYGAFNVVLSALKQSSPEQAEALFADLLQAFRMSPGRYADISEFERLVIGGRMFASDAAYREALTMAVAAIDRLPTTGLPDVSFRIYNNGSNVSLSGAASVLLMRLVPMLRQVDPKWAQQVLDEHDDLAKFEQARSVPFAGPTTLMSSSTNEVISGPRPASPAWRQQVGPVRAAADNSAEAAQQFAQHISDPNARAAANAEIAGALAQQNPQQAAVYLTQARQALDSIDDPVQKLTLLTSLARASYANHDLSSAGVYMDRGFTLGEEVVRADYDANPDKPVTSLKGVSDLTALVMTGMRLDAPSTVVRINAIRYPVLRVHLLIAAAEAVQQGRIMREGGVGTSRRGAVQDN